MKVKKSLRYIVLTIMFVFLLILPLYIEMYHPPLYYVGVIALIALIIVRELVIGEEKLEKRFYKRWHRARKKGFWKNVVQEGLRSFVVIVLAVGFAQFVGNGRSPVEIVLQLPTGAFIFVICFLVLISLVSGTLFWYENEKKYNRIDWDRGSE